MNTEKKAKSNLMDELYLKQIRTKSFVIFVLKDGGVNASTDAEYYLMIFL